MNHTAPESPLLSWDDKGLPHSGRFDDKYFCKDNGLAESLHVFCNGNHLTERLMALLPGQTLTIVETGFGTGLNFLCVWDLWRRNAIKGKVHFISVDKYPLSPGELTQALALWPQLRDCSNQLLSCYDPNQHCLQAAFEESHVLLTVIFDEITIALKEICEQGIKADAFFLDGFAPSKNPDMWSEQVFQSMAAISHETTTLATFTCAGFVRRGLQEVGFLIKKQPGYGNKRHMIAGQWASNGIKP